MDICRNILIVIFLFSFTFSYSQSIDAIKKKNEKTEKEIAYLNKLLENARKDKSSTIQKVSIINQKIGKGKEMIQSLTNEVNYLDGQIKKNESVKSALESDKQRMLEFYSKMVYEIWKKRNESDKLIYISMGTVINDSTEFYKKCIEALANKKYQVIMSVGNLINIEDLGAVPYNITISRFVDQIAVLSQADVFLTHCGMNSVNESLYYKVPLVMYPQTSEQDGVATRVEQLGAGIRLKYVNAKSITETIENVLHTKSYYEQAAKISEGFHKCTGVKGAADKIEQMCK